MVLGLLILSSIPVVTGIAEGISAQKSQRQNKDDKKRMRKFNIDVYCDAKSSRTKEINGGRLVLRDNRVWVAVAQPGQENGYLCSAFYIQYPDSERNPPPLGLVSQVHDDPPLLNWLYVDKETMELRYGNRTASREHWVGHWDWTEDEAGITLEGYEHFTVAEDGQGHWQVFFDNDDDGLKCYVPKPRRRFKVSLERVLLDEISG